MNGLLLGAGVLALIALYASKKGDGRNYVPEKQSKGAIPKDAPAIPVLTPPEQLSIPLGTSDVLSKDVFRQKSGSVTFLPAIFADQTMLYSPSIKEDYLALAKYLETHGFPGITEYAMNRLANYDKPAVSVLVGFDKGLDAQTRATIFFQFLAQERQKLYGNLTSPYMAKFPMFRESMWNLAKLEDEFGPAPWKSAGNTTQPGTAQKKTLTDTEGPATVTNAKGQSVNIPKNGRLRGGELFYTVQNGDVTAAIMAEKWGKKPGAVWSQDIVKANPGVKFGTSDVHVGKELSMPSIWLEDVNGQPGAPSGGKPSSSPPKGSGNTGGGTVKPPKPTTKPADGYEWIYVPALNEWAQVPIEDDGDDGDESGDDGDDGEEKKIPPKPAVTTPGYEWIYNASSNEWEQHQLPMPTATLPDGYAYQFVVGEGWKVIKVDLSGTEVEDNPDYVLRLRLSGMGWIMGILSKVIATVSSLPSVVLSAADWALTSGAEWAFGPLTSEGKPAYVNPTFKNATFGEVGYIPDVPIGNERQIVVNLLTARRSVTGIQFSSSNVDEIVKDFQRWDRKKLPVSAAFAAFVALTYPDDKEAQEYMQKIGEGKANGKTLWTELFSFVGDIGSQVQGSERQVQRMVDAYRNSPKKVAIPVKNNEPGGTYQ